MILSEEARLQILEKLSGLEDSLLALDATMVAGALDRSLIHGLFREAHNCKSSLSMAGVDESVPLLHALESSLDLFRSDQGSPSPAWMDASLAAIDLVRESVASGEELSLSLVSERAQSILSISASTEAVRGGPGSHLSLPPEQMGLLSSALQQGQSLYRVEKLVGSGMSEQDARALPVFDTLSEIGSLISWSLSPAVKGGDTALLTLLFTTALPEGELDFVIFDPLTKLRSPSELASGRSDVPEKRSEPTVDEAGASPDQDSRIPRILLVDDESLALLVLQRFLSRYGRVDSSSQAADALRVFTGAPQDDPYDLVFLDIMMPDMDGLEVLNQFRIHEASLGIQVGDGAKIVMESALSDFSVISASFRELCDAYLVKPFTQASVDDTMKKLGYAPLVVDAQKVPTATRRGVKTPKL